MNQNSNYTPDIDVSYVYVHFQLLNAILVSETAAHVARNGFSVPISCSCIGEDSAAHSSGCSGDLWFLHSCAVGDNNCSA